MEQYKQSISFFLVTAAEHNFCWHYQLVGRYENGWPPSEIAAIPQAVQEYVSTKSCRLAPKTYWNDPFWLLKLSFILALYYYSHHRFSSWAHAKFHKFYQSSRTYKCKILTDGSDWNKYGRPSFQPHISSDTPKGRTPLQENKT